jgi:hypothetical protein
MTVASITSIAKTIGKRAVVPTRWLSDLAVGVARATIDGEAEPDDALDLYLAYFDASIKRSPAQTPSSLRVQASKLRQVMKLAERHPKTALALLEKVTDLHAELLGTTRVKSLFAAMVDVARAQLMITKPLTERELRALIAQPKRSRR